MPATARRIKEVTGTGTAYLYELSEPVHYEGREQEVATFHVVVSATVAMFSGPETYIFPADSDGNVLDWGELDGSFRGSLDHAAALAGAGYEEVT